MDKLEPITIGPQWSIWDYIPGVSSFIVAALLAIIALFLVRHWLMFLLVLVMVVVWAYMVEFIKPASMFGDYLLGPFNIVLWVFLLFVMAFHYAKEKNIGKYILFVTLGLGLSIISTLIN